MSIELVISSIALLLFGVLVISNLSVRLQNRKLFIKAAQAETDRLTVYLQSQEILKREAEKIESKDGFVKFMSQSRDWAFEYIEKVQSDLYDLNDVFKATGGKPKTVAQNNALTEAVRKVLENLPEEGKK